jgi:hypothetical protein
MAIIIGDPYTPPSGTFSTPTTNTSSFSAANVGGWAQMFGVLASAWGARVSAKAEKQNLKFQGDMARLNASYSSRQTLLSASYSEAMASLNAQSVRQTADYNAKISELGAQSALLQGEKDIAKLTLSAGQMKATQRAAMAANGIDLGEGNAVDVQASTDIMKEIDMNQIEANAIRSAWGYRTQGVAQQMEGANQAVNITIAGNNEAMNIRTRGAQELFSLQGTANANYAASNAISPDNQMFTTLATGAMGAADTWYKWKKATS